VGEDIQLLLVCVTKKLALVHECTPKRREGAYHCVDCFVVDGNVTFESGVVSFGSLLIRLIEDARMTWVYSRNSRLYPDLSGRGRDQPHSTGLLFLPVYSQMPLSATTPTKGREIKRLALTSGNVILKLILRRSLVILRVP
jgi:hypothetical protein